MTDLRTAAQQALEALEMARMNGEAGLHKYETLQIAESAEALRTALAEPVQEGCDHCNQPLYAAVKCRMCGRVTEPLQEPVAWSHINGTSDTKWHPPQRQPLTEEEILSVLRLAPPEPSLWPHLKDEAVVGDVQKAVLAIARAIERAHGIGGNA